MRGLIRIQNEDNTCFRCCLVRYLLPVNKKTQKIRSVDKEFPKHLNFKSIEFRIHKKTIQKLKKKDIFINVFGYENKTLYRIITQNKRM